MNAAKRREVEQVLKKVRDITGPRWDKFQEDHPDMAAVTVKMIAQDVSRLLEDLLRDKTAGYSYDRA